MFDFKSDILFDLVEMNFKMSGVKCCRQKNGHVRYPEIYVLESYKSEEKLYTQYEVDDILSENERLKRENEELKEKSDKLLQNFLDFESFSREIGTVPDIVLTDGNGAYAKKIHGAPNRDNSCDCKELRDKIYRMELDISTLEHENGAIEAENKRLKKEYETADLEREHLAKQIQELKGKIAELNDRHQQDCIDLNKKQTTINELVDDYSELRRQMGLS